MGNLEQPIHITSIEAAANLVKNLFVGFDGNVCAANAKALGVCNADVNVGQMASVVDEGIALVISGAAVSVGAAVASDSAGKAVAAAAFAAAAPAITVDDTKLTIDADSTPVLSTAANGAIITAASGFLTPAAPALSGGVLPVAVNGYAMDEAVGANELIRVKLV
jgi:hypothetical protein